MFNIIAGLNIVAQLTFIGLLLFCCYRTRSKGVILLSVILLLSSGIFSSIFQHFYRPYIDQWTAGEMSNWLTQSMTLG